MIAPRPHRRRRCALPLRYDRTPTPVSAPMKRPGRWPTVIRAIEHYPHSVQIEGCSLGTRLGRLRAALLAPIVVLCASGVGSGCTSTAGTDFSTASAAQVRSGVTD